jgi:hypothetical protein
MPPFGLTWRAPTGSAERCLGDRAAFLGVPGDIGPCRSMERVTGIEPAFSAWEIDSGSFVTCTVLEKTSSAVLSGFTSVAL